MVSQCSNIELTTISKGKIGSRKIQPQSQAEIEELLKFLSNNTYST